MEQLQRKLHLSAFVKLPFSLFTITGIRLFKYRPYEIQPLNEKIAFTFVVFDTVPQTILIALTPFLYEFSNPIEMTAYICYTCYLANSFFKVVAVWNGRLVLHDIIKGMDKMFPKTEEEAIAYCLEENYKNITFLMKAIVIFNLTSTNMFNLFPTIQSLFEYITSGNFMRRFPFIIYYPFDPTEFTVVYIILYVAQGLGACILSIFFLGGDLFLVMAVHHVCMHFTFLTNKIENFEPTGTDKDVVELNSFIEYHCKIMSLITKINEVFSIATLLNYIASGGVICMIGIQITAGTEILHLFKFFVFLILSLVHVYFVCIFGSNLIDQSIGLSNAIFSHKWYLGNNKYRKMIPLLIARAQKPMFLKASKFIVVSMESFQALLSNSYQIFTLLRTKFSTH